MSTEKSTANDPIEVGYVYWSLLTLYTMFSSAFIVSKVWHWFLEKPINIHLDYVPALCLLVALSWAFKSKIMCVERPKTMSEVIGYIVDPWVFFGVCFIYHCLYPQ